MSALADALVAAQRRAISSLEKTYTAGPEEDAALALTLDAIGCTDKVDQERLIACLTVIKATGASLPAEPTASPQGAAEEPMSPKQRSFIVKLWEERGGKPDDRPDTQGLSKERASELITQLQAGTYNPADWSIPF